ncbi:GNAT family N-acetyltransferase [Gracilibacillus salinarum]|uniref:GNAT family N-acetyltransferase n=1 Tax=Gracilibacillus salinarum TaxID=2932255 RepID=A0ABY4GST5_9BACI|nr:GNAT family N-acetyltransferase [Gracilibacillus salinarum]UOQ87445.1 GNAT family N-acetyltransferase [Gracilibacillus salinarum]
MYVNLYHLPQVYQKQQQDWVIRRALPLEKDRIIDWVQAHFPQWKNECEVACSALPANCLIAVKNKDILGFACYETTFKNFFGPTGVIETARGKGIGYQLLIHSLHEMRHLGYAYAIIGDAGPVDFYKKVIGADVIDRPSVLEEWTPLSK